MSASRPIAHHLGILPPVGFSRTEAAAHIGVGATKFDEMVRDGRMPRPKRIDCRTVYDRLAVKKAFHELPEDGQPDDDIIL